MPQAACWAHDCAASGAMEVPLMQQAAAADVIQRHAAPVPRYTSYPTANHFSAAVGPALAADWLAALPTTTILSLYSHIPYCRELCWYCGCATKAVRRYEPVASYVDLLIGEVDRVVRLLPTRFAVNHIHWGGGSPDILAPGDIERYGQHLHRAFDVRSDAEIAVEIDPRLLHPEQVDAFAAIGVNRISIGVQDFDPAVQHAIGRLQSFETTERAVDLFRQRGIASINIDLVYGLPQQSEASLARTLEQVLRLAPDRLAIFGYAHLPQRLKHQRLIADEALPGPSERYAQSRLVTALLSAAGYVQLGLDHFAKAHDTLATKPLARNFQGYTTDDCDALIGFGASAISRLPQGYMQNAVTADAYERLLAEGGLATARGWALSDEDRVRSHVIERLMCDFTLSASELRHRFGGCAAPIVDEMERLIDEDTDGFILPDADGFSLTDKGRPFVRTICARFDAYLPAELSNRRHALSV